VTIFYTATCRECRTDDPFIYASEAQRDSEAHQHMESTGHSLAVGYFDTDEPAPYQCPRCQTLGIHAADLNEFKKDHNERVCAYGF
jgi:hypothetical protein